MKYTKPLLRSALATCVILAAAGCQTLDSTFSTITKPVQVATVETNDTIISQLIVLNKSEVEQSKIALKKAHHHRVKAYAAKMNRAHSMGLKETMRVSQQTGIKPVMNITSQNLQNQNNLQLAGLNLLSGNAFDKAYIDNQVTDHQAALTQIDEDMKLSTNPKLTKLLKDTRHHVVRHLEAAKKIQKALAH